MVTHLGAVLAHLTCEAVLGFELMASHMKSMNSTAELHAYMLIVVICRAAQVL